MGETKYYYYMKRYGNTYPFEDEIDKHEQKFDENLKNMLCKNNNSTLQSDNPVKKQIPYFFYIPNTVFLFFKNQINLINQYEISTF